MRKYRYKLNIAYDGYNYQGWQKQPFKKTIQEEIEENLNKICGNKKLSVEASGRTDAGVHAKCQIAHFDIDKTLNTLSVKNSLNCLLKDDIRINSLVKVSTDFHSRFDVKSKEYRYLIHNANILPPHIRHFRHHESRSLDVQEMQNAADCLIGKHDFASFYVNPGYKINNTVREIYTFDVKKKDSSSIVIKVSGNGFLYKMVRSLAGFLIDVGLGKFNSNYAYELLNNLKRSKEVKTAPAKGLFLWKVNY